MPQYVFEVHLTVQAPLLSQATGGRKQGLDSITVRDHEGNPCLLGSSIRGNLRHAWQYLASVSKQVPLEQCQKWLGIASRDGENNAPRRARLSFAYYWCWKPTEEDKQRDALTPRCRIHIDPETGTVQKGALQIIESPFETGESVNFVGNIYASLENEAESEQLLLWLRKGLQYISALGALRGVGFGRVIQVAIRKDRHQPADSVQAPTSARFGIALKPDRPFCFAKHHSQNNHFASETFITGAAILGSLAHYLPEYPVLARHFDKLIISHAFPSNKPIHPDAFPSNKLTRPLAIPKSFAAANEQLYDLSLQKNAGLIQKTAPEFMPDWKSKIWEKANALCGQVSLSHSVHTHTAITATGEDDEDGRLFSMEVIHPNDYQWLAHVNCEAVPEVDRTQVLKDLSQIFAQGLYGLGKTKAYAQVTCHSTPFNTPVEADHLPDKRDETFVLMLQTPALLLPDPYNIPPTNGGDDLFKRYAALWESLTGGAFELSHFYAHQQLVGGNYLQQRFWSDQQVYNPAVLTSAGSVFVFIVHEVEQTRDILRRWLSQGLPQHESTFGGTQWQQNPYLANHGYGEIVINPQWETCSLQDVWEALQ